MKYSKYVKLGVLIVITLTILILFVEGLKKVFPFNPEKDN